MANPPTEDSIESIAVIGMAIRFPGANNTDTFWHNLQNGIESVTFFSHQQLETAGVDPSLLEKPGYVKAKSILDGIEMFDASFFGFSPREAEILDPQQRVFLECAWEALENAGYDPETSLYRIAVYAGTSRSSYLVNNIRSNPGVMESVGAFQVLLANDKDHLTTRVSYKLNLRGPSINVNTACSTSLVAVCLACQGLLNYQSDIALAGGVSIVVPQVSGYLYQEGGIASIDGHCRSFDARAKGAVFGNGAGIVVLKRLADAIADGDTVHAVIKGFGINNDGSMKVGYTAPSADGQAEVIAEAMALGGVKADTISYVEAHGTATPMGDPIEVSALSKAFRAQTARCGFCAIGSVKTNLGHLNSAAGIAGLVKTILALRNKKIPPSLHFEKPNPEIDFSSTPFYVNTRLIDWEAGRTPRRASVSSFGIGGTNANVVLEEAPERPNLDNKTKLGEWHLLLLSAKTYSALRSMSANLASHMRQQSEIDLGNVAHTLQVGRKAFPHRHAIVCKNRDEALAGLEQCSAERLPNHSRETRTPMVVFMFPGQGAQYINMGLPIYNTIPSFRKDVDSCAELLRPLLKMDMRSALYPAEIDLPTAAQQLDETSISQPILFVISYALAKLWMQWGVQPKAMVGHSVGEYVAACLAGVFSIEDALGAIVLRGTLMKQLPRGSMLSVALSEAELLPFLGKSLSIAAINTPRLCTVSGPVAAVSKLEKSFNYSGIACQRLHTSHAFHSKMMDPVIEIFTQHLEKLRLNPNRIPFVSAVTGTWVTEDQVTNPDYWAGHLRQCVRYSDCLSRLMELPDCVLIEVGPGQTLSTFARQHPNNSGYNVLSSLPHPLDRRPAEEHLLRALGRLWCLGTHIEWPNFHTGQNCRRIPLPTYPFERKSFWIEPAKRLQVSKPDMMNQKLNFTQWFHKPIWKESPLEPSCNAGVLKNRWLIFLDEFGPGPAIVAKLEQLDQEIITVSPGSDFSSVGNAYIIDPRLPQGYYDLVAQLATNKGMPSMICHMWGASENHQCSSEDFLDGTLNVGLHSLIWLAQALGRHSDFNSILMTVVTTGMQKLDVETIYPEKATILGPCRVIPKEYPKIKCRSIDMILPAAGDEREKILDDLVQDLLTDGNDKIIALRGDKRWVQDFEPVCVEEQTCAPVPLRHGGTYLITGGLGGIGLALAEYLAGTIQPKLVLVGRSEFPNKGSWDAWLNTHDEDDPISRKIFGVKKIEALGAEVLIVSANVANRHQMEEAVAVASQRFGQIHGVVHAAGVPDGAAIQRRSREMTDAVLAPKVRGALVLGTIFHDADLDFLVHCSSLASVLGPFGQVAYCAANAFLDALANSKSVDNGTTVVSINWDVWKEAGMTVQPKAPQPALISSPEIDPSKMSHPLFEQHWIHGTGQDVFVSQLSPKKHWVLGEHRINRIPTLPGTAYLELAREAFRVRTGTCTCKLWDVYFLRPLTVPETEEKEVRTILRKNEEAFEFLVLSRESGDDDAWQEHAKGKIAAADMESPRIKSIQQIETACHKELDVLHAFDSFNDRMEFGARWRGLKRLQLGNGEGLAEVELKEAFTPDMELYALHPALMDIATGFLAPTTGGEGTYLPFYYKKIVVKENVTARLFSHAVAKDRDRSSKEVIKFDISIMDAEGRVLVEIDEYTLRRVHSDRLAVLMSKSREEAGEEKIPKDTRNYCLNESSPGVLDSLAFRHAARLPPKADEVEIEVSFAGLNFKDVLLAYAALPGIRDNQSPLGLECAGRITALGEKVENFNIGEEVIALAPAAFSSYVLAPASLVALKPEKLSNEEAATIPVSFMTAYHALVKLGRLSKGERLLIHAAAGGVGMAAVKIAQWLGAEIFATAGSPEKREFLRTLGVEHIYDSRSLAFADEIMKETGGHGVNAVLNSLAGEFVSTSISVLAPYGRFLEIGIRDILLNSQLAMRPFAKSLSFFAIMLGPQIPGFASTWQELVGNFRDGHLTPLPYCVFPATAVTDAFNFMAQAKHIGKILISMKDKSAIAERAEAGGHEGMGMHPGRTAKFTHYLSNSAQNRPAPDPLKLYSVEAGITIAEGQIAFSRILGTRLPQIVVSTRDLRTRIDKSESFSPDKIRQAIESSGIPKTMHARPDLRTIYTTPRNEVEQRLAEIWQQLFGIGDIGIHDNFFDLGGHSLLALQINSRVWETFQVELPPESLFEEPTIAILAEQIEAVLSARDLQGDPAIQREGTREEFVL